MSRDLLRRTTSDQSAVAIQRPRLYRGKPVKTDERTRKIQRKKLLVMKRNNKTIKAHEEQELIQLENYLHPAVQLVAAAVNPHTTNEADRVIEVMKPLQKEVKALTAAVLAPKTKKKKKDREISM